MFLGAASTARAAQYETNTIKHESTLTADYKIEKFSTKSFFIV